MNSISTLIVDGDFACKDRVPARCGIACCVSPQIVANDRGEKFGVRFTVSRGRDIPSLSTHRAACRCLGAQKAANKIPTAKKSGTRVCWPANGRRNCTFASLNNHTSPRSLLARCNNCSTREISPGATRSSRLYQASSSDIY